MNGIVSLFIVSSHFLFLGLDRKHFNITMMPSEKYKTFWDYKTS